MPGGYHWAKDWQYGSVKTNDGKTKTMSSHGTMSMGWKRPRCSSMRMKAVERLA